MLDLLDRLRQKPDYVRFQIAIAVAGVITFIIAAIWLITLQFKLSDRPAPEQASPESASLISEWGAAFSSIWGEGKKQIESLNESFNSLEYQAEE